MARAEPASRGGVLVVDKPAGPTSHDVVDRVRRALGERRVGHTGTLDPFATGVLVVCVGKATRLVRFLAEGDKVYRATVRLGFATTTDDLTGEALGEPRPPLNDDAAIRAAAASLVGALDQVPPAYSAKRVGGRRLYEMARAGGDVEGRTASRVQVHDLTVLRVQGDEVDIHVRCSPGTYVRALARDLGEALGVGGHLVALRRLASGPYRVENALPAGELSSASWDRVLPLAELLPAVPAVRLNSEGVRALEHGRPLWVEDTTEGFPLESSASPWLRLLGGDGSLLGLAVPKPGGPSEGQTLTLQPSIVLI